MSPVPVYNIEKLSFSGPLDLLLSLIHKNQFDIYDIPIALIADQYLSYLSAMDETDLDILSDFIVMAATLMDIKARMLVYTGPDEDEEAADPREELTGRLIAYRQLRALVAVLRAREEATPRYIYNRRDLPDAPGSLKLSPDIGELLEGVSAESLRALYNELMSRRKRADNEEALKFAEIRRDKASLVRYLDHVARYAMTHRHFRFREMFSDGADRTEVVVSFLALLELMHLGRINVRQTRSFGDIDVEVNDSRSMDLDLGKILDI